MMDLKAIVEGLIFVSGKALGTSEMMEILEGIPEGPRPTRQELAKVLEALGQEWEERGRGVVLARVAEGYEFRSRSELAPWIRLLLTPKPHRLSAPAVETLALVAYRQPLTRVEIESVRGVDSAAVLKHLLERRLIRVVGRKEEPGRPLLYATTKEFLELFGLKDLSDLPPLKEFEEKIKERSADSELSLSDLAVPPEEGTPLSEEDLKALEELDQSLKELKVAEKEVLATLTQPAEEKTEG